MYKSMKLFKCSDTCPLVFLCCVRRIIISMNYPRVRCPLSFPVPSILVAPMKASSICDLYRAFLSSSVVYYSVKLSINTSNVIFGYTLLLTISSRKTIWNIWKCACNIRSQTYCYSKFFTKCEPSLLYMSRL